MKTKLGSGLLLAAIFAVWVSGCAKKNEKLESTKSKIPIGESHMALAIAQAQYLFFYSDSIVSTIQPLFSSSSSNGCAWVQVCAAAPTSFTLQSVKSVFSSAYPQAQVRLMYATAPISNSGTDPYDTSWQLSPNVSTLFPASCRDVFVAQYQTAPGGAWTPFDRVTVMDTAYNPMPGPSQYWITTPGEYYFNFVTKDDTTAAAACAVTIQ